MQLYRLNSGTFTRTEGKRRVRYVRGDVVQNGGGKPDIPKAFIKMFSSIRDAAETPVQDAGQSTKAKPEPTVSSVPPEPPKPPAPPTPPEPAGPNDGKPSKTSKPETKSAGSSKASK